MFFNGDLQAGISVALQEQKLVVCFVRDTGEQSIIWENEWLQDNEIVTGLTSKAVVLRIEFGSQEAQYLSAVCPISSSPTILAIKNGRLVLHLSSGLSEEQFKQSFMDLLNGENPSSTTATISPMSTSSTPSRTRATGEDISTTSTAALAPNDPASDSNIQTMYDERRVRLEADRKRKNDAEKAKLKAEAAAREAEILKADPGSVKASQISWAQKQAQRNREARQERERILKIIENDKVERRHKEEARKAIAKAQAEGDTGDDSILQRQLSNELKQNRPKTSFECAIQVRLFNGGSIRAKFPANQTLRTEVRDWIGQQRTDGDAPYIFRQVLTPMPNRVINISEEDESLHTLGLTPSATLVMVPVSNYTGAYSAESGYISKGVSAGYSILAGGLGLVGSVVESIFGAGRAVTPPPSGEQTMQGERRNERQQLYNGNQLNFEPRPDDEEKKDS